jgi:hypothetical protein
LVTVSLLGAPSLYSSVPMLDSTLSGVVFDAGICATADSGTSTLSAKPSAMVISFGFMFLSKAVVGGQRP